MAKATGRGWEPQHSDYTEAIYAPYVALIGQIALSWNSLHERLAHLFWVIMGGGFMDQPIGVWNSQNFDRARREMLRAATVAATPRELADHPKLIDDVTWLLARADDLEHKRNDAVHSPLYAASNILVHGIVPPVISDDMLKNRRAMNLAGKNLMEEFAWCRDSIIVLCDFAVSVERALTADGARWPDKPSLPTRLHQRTPP
jgi:hypothetical protein